jgi:uncharacterized damage-inducible protein DinB
MATATRSAVTPDFVFAYRELILSTMAAEMQTTKKVIGAIPESAKGYKPDPKSKNAHELAWHIVSDDVAFLNKIADMKIAMTEPLPAPGTIAEILKYYEENLPKAIKRVLDMSTEQLLTPVSFFGVMNQPVYQYLLMVNNHSVHIAASFPPTCAPCGRRCRASTVAAPTSRLNRRLRAQGHGS